MISKDYYYELKYIADDVEIVMKFNADIDADGLKHNLGDFLKGCSWSEELVNNYILSSEDYDNGEEDDTPTLEDVNGCGRCLNSCNNGGCGQCGTTNLE